MPSYFSAAPLFQLAFSLNIVVATLSVGTRPATAASHGWKNVKKWFVEAQSENLTDSPAGRRASRRIVVATTDQLAYFVGHPDDQRGIDWKNEPFNLDIRIRNEELIRHYRFNRLVEVDGFPLGSTIPDPIRRDILFFFIPVWPLQGYRAPYVDDPEMIFVVGEALESEDYELTPERELVEQEWCRVARSKNDIDRIWIAEKKDLCVMRRQWYVNKSRTMMGELVAKEVSEVAPGLWMPTEIGMTYWSVRGKDQRREQVLHRITRILRCEIDDHVPSDALDVRFRPGTVERTSRDVAEQLSPGGTEHLRDIANFYRDHTRLPEQPTIAEWWLATAFQVFVGALAGVCFGVLPFRPAFQRLIQMLRRSSGVGNWQSR